MLKRAIKKLFHGVSWQHPLIKIVIKIINPLDRIARSFSGLSQLPPYSDRVVSNGITQQFGGKGFHTFGEILSNQLQQKAGLTPSSRVLEIGCGCGRTAMALTEVLEDAHFTGMDIHKGSIESCLKNKKLTAKGFTFNHLDVQNNEYNPKGPALAKDFVFPYKLEAFDVIFMVSVFTHMLTDDVKNYIKEISRMMAPGGICMVTTFIMDEDKKMHGMSFPHKEQEHFYYNESLPEEAIGYELGFFQKEFALHNMELKSDPAWGGWRQNPNVPSDSGFSQDILFFTKPNGTN